MARIFVSTHTSQARNAISTSRTPAVTYFFMNGCSSYLGEDEAEGGAYAASHPPPIVLLAQSGIS